MHLIALLLGLVVERQLTHLLRLRELRWFDAYFDWGLRTISTAAWPVALVGVLLLIALPLVPVVLLSYTLGGVFLHFPYLVFAIVVLLISLGPRDLATEVDEFALAAESGDQALAARVAKELLERDPPANQLPQPEALEEAVFVQANNRIFGVVLWFMLLGPVGAWLFRVSDLLRRRAVYETSREQISARCVRMVQRLHGLLAWLPARLLALGFALAGGFDGALSEWRGYYRQRADDFFDVSNHVVASAGAGALGATRTQRAASADSGATAAQSVRDALGLVKRTLLVWLTAIAVLTIAGWAT